MAWNSQQYLKFGKERTQACVDLVSKSDGNYKSILDLGCGPANSTKLLLNKYKNADVIGMDFDDDMLARAQKDCPDAKFIKGYIPNDFDKIERKFDLVFSNACIHWVDDQQKLIDSVCELLNDNGTFAVQIPLTDESQFYKALYRLINEKWTKLKSVKNFHNFTAAQYYNALIKKFDTVEMWQTDYYHIVGKDMVIEWYKGSGLRPYLALLDEKEQAEFISDLQEIINREYSVLDDGNVFLIMPRLFFVAKK